MFHVLTEKKQNDDTPDKNELQANKIDMDEETLAELAFEEYMTIMDSLFPEVFFFMHKNKY